jgi:signal transduction histidine kinase
MFLHDLLDWFVGGPRHRYMTLVHCMDHDVFWIAVTVSLDLAVALGYVLIALHWWHNERGAADSPAKVALRSMKNIFLFCGLCGYVFIPIKMFWPAWRLYDGFMAVLVCLTWRYALKARELNVVYNELGQTERLRSDLEASREEGRRKSYFLNAVSHDLKTPLNGLVLQAELARITASTGDAESLRESLDQIKACARVTSDLLDNFLELGKLDWSEDTLHPTECRLKEVLDAVVGRSLPEALKKGLSLTVDVPETLTVRTDAGKLGRVVANLVENAVKFTRQGGVRISAEPTAVGVSVRVADTGEGIAPADLARVFDDFIQVHNRERDSRKGYGLGLGIARRLARQLGGHLTAESEPGRGSRFSLELPAHAVRPPESRAEGPRGSRPAVTRDPAAAPPG